MNFIVHFLLAVWYVFFGVLCPQVCPSDIFFFFRSVKGQLYSSSHTPTDCGLIIGRGSRYRDIASKSSGQTLLSLSMGQLFICQYKTMFCKLQINTVFPGISEPLVCIICFWQIAQFDSKRIILVK